MSAIEIALKIEMIEGRNNFDKDKIHSIIVANRVNILLLTIQSNLGIIIAYLTIYIILVMTNLKTRDALTPELRAALRRRMVSLAILFASICQMYVVRIYRDVEYAIEFRVEADSHFFASHIC